MINRHDPWKWPISISTTLLFLWAVFFALPASWIDYFFSPLHNLEDRTIEHQGWLTLLPPPEVEIQQEEKIPEPAEPLPPQQDFQEAQWWTRGWQIRIEDSKMRAPRTVPIDSIQVVLHELGLTKELQMFARPDSALAARLMLLRVEDSFRYEELKPYLQAMGKSKAYADILSRAADMYGDFLQYEIMVPD